MRLPQVRLSLQGMEAERENRPVQECAAGLGMRIQELQCWAGRRVKMAYLLPRLVWQLGSQVGSAGS